MEKYKQFDLLENRVEENYERYREKFIAEKIMPYAHSYDYSEFNNNDFVTGLRGIKESYSKEGNTYNVDVDSFSVGELEELWQVVDSSLSQRQIENEVGISLEERIKINSGKWAQLPDGKLIAKAKNPCVTGGVHGNEKTLPKDMEKALASQRDPLISLNKALGYSNWEVNQSAYNKEVRSFSVSENIVDDGSDMNRANINDHITRGIKGDVLSKIGAYDEPFLLDCHNDNFMESETNPGKKLPQAYVSEKGDLGHKISLAMELGLHRVTIVPHEAMTGTMVESLREINQWSDGMTVEVDGGDTNGTSAKIALRFLEISRAFKNHRPSSGVQILHEFQTTFLPANPNLKIFKMEIILEDQLGADPSAHYMVTNGMPIKITSVRIKDGVMSEVPITDEDKELF